ncbi:hypothetical protein QAD02_022201 [Eretmocerus hayati]|uniref:Uncharacterized protein n=1 Tax=Eretmocerus hayati TaxID=131215 RepID=A0ACC2PSL3_9HYME|nr:hypothetical protein QAD02_022201 [Eretmocerus hayati]
MNEVSSTEEDVFKNPENKPLEELKITIKQNGVTQAIPALDKHWLQERYLCHYECPHLVDSDGRDIIGAKERWMEITGFIIDDLIWLLQLPFYKFWSTVIHDRAVVDTMIIFLQDAPVYYSLDNFPNDPEMFDQLNRLRHYVLVLFARMVTSEESPTEYITPKYHASLIYNKYLVSVPILMDLCQHYGRDNRKTVEKIVNTAFKIQPLYEKDTEKAATFLVEQALGNVEKRFEDCPSNQEGAVLLSERGGARTEMSLTDLEDMILYTLDIVSNINIFLSIHSQSVNSFKSDMLFIKLVSFYGVTIPEMYKRLDNLAYKDETIEKYMELKHRLDVTRVEILTVYRTVVYNGIENILNDGASHSATELDEIIDDFCINLEFTLCERAFVMDFFNIYPVTEDFQTLINLHPDLNSVRFDYILNSVFSNFDGKKTPPSTSSARTKKASQPTPGPSTIGISQPSTSSNLNGLDRTPMNNKRSDVEIMALILEVKDILCDLGEGFIEKCLKHYNYSKESVVNAIFEGSLPPELESLDRSLPLIPPDPEEASAEMDAAIGIQRLNIYDNDEFDVMTKDVIDTSRVHKGKRKDKFKNANELLNDKSHLAATKELYNKYSIVTSEYDDEYDDTYDDQDIGSSAQDDCVEVDARPFTIPRILRKQEQCDLDDDVDEEHDLATNSGGQITADQFVQDPALLRAKAEERYWSKRGGRSFYSRNKDVVGNAKGQGQSKEVVDNRNQKGKSKATRANHNRRAGSQWKRSHGMVPS